MDDIEEVEVLVAVGQTIARLCEVSVTVTDPEFKDLLFDATLSLLKRIIPPEPAAGKVLTMFEGRKQ